MTPLTDTIYIVDDDVSVRSAVRRLLRSAQYLVRTFASAEEFRQTDYRSFRGCLLLDIRLPGMSGFELQEELLAKGMHMPVIFITGHDRAGMEERARELGCKEYLRKPFDDKALLEAIRAAMESQAEREAGK